MWAWERPWWRDWDIVFDTKLEIVTADRMRIGWGIQEVNRVIESPVCLMIKSQTCQQGWSKKQNQDWCNIWQPYQICNDRWTARGKVGMKVFIYSGLPQLLSCTKNFRSFITWKTVMSSFYQQAAMILTSVGRSSMAWRTIRIGRKSIEQ